MLEFSRAPALRADRGSRASPSAGELLADRRFGVILLDLGLPDAHGLDGPARAAPRGAGGGDHRAQRHGERSARRRGAARLARRTTSSRGAGTATRWSARSASRSRGARPRSRSAGSRRSSSSATTRSSRSTSTAGSSTWNPGAERLLGYRADEVIGQPVAMLVPPECVAEQRGLLAQVLAGQRVEGLETRRMHRDGSAIDVSLGVSAIFDAQGGVIAIAKIARDITASARAAASLRAAQERFRAAFEEAPIGMALIGLDGRFMKRQHRARRDHRVRGRSISRGARSPRSPTPTISEFGGPGVEALLAGKTSRYGADRRYVHASGQPLWAGPERHVRARQRRGAAAPPGADAGHHRSSPLRGPAAAHGRSRSADRPAQPPRASSASCAATSCAASATACRARR